MAWSVQNDFSNEFSHQPKEIIYGVVATCLKMMGI
jgi:hypothetical protein